MFADFVNRITSKQHNAKAVAVFCRVMLVFALIKILFIWNASLTLLSYHKFAAPGSLIGKVIFLPSLLANSHLDVVYIVFVIVLIVLVILPWNYISGVLFFWITFNLYRLNIPLMNGSDNVQLVLAGCMVPMVMWSRTQSIRSGIQVISFNTVVVMAQLIVACIYFISGCDKLLTEAWRTGEAFVMIAQREQRAGIWGSGIFDNAAVNAFLSWITIIFELAFVVFIWFRQFRLPLLAVGVVFHLVIAFTLTLYDFSLVMIASYFVFLTDADYDRFYKGSIH